MHLCMGVCVCVFVLYIYIYTYMFCTNVPFNVICPLNLFLGLFPLLGHAAMNVRPSLLTVYETHFVPLGERLRPGLSGFLSGVLPGLEEGSDHFDR